MVEETNCQGPMLIRIDPGALVAVVVALVVVLVVVFVVRGHALLPTFSTPRSLPRTQTAGILTATHVPFLETRERRKGCYCHPMGTGTSDR